MVYIGDTYVLGQFFPSFLFHRVTARPSVTLRGLCNSHEIAINPRR